MDALSTPCERNIMGQFATPQALAADIAQYVGSLWKHRGDQVRLLEPAVGSGAFFSALRNVIPASRWETAVGVEIDSRYADLASKLWGPFGLKVEHGDFTRLEPPRDASGQANLIVTNPPYVRHHHIDSEEKWRLKSMVFTDLGIGISGLAGLYCYFMLLADSWLAPGGLSVWLIPTEFMEVNYGAAVCRYLTTRVSLRQVHVFDRSDVQFDDALVSSAIVVFEKSRPAPNHEVLFSSGPSFRVPSVSRLVPNSELGERGKWTKYLSDSACADLGSKSGVVVLGDLFTIRRGIATGANRFFVLPRRDWQSMGIPDKFLRPILPSPKSLREHIVETCRDGFPSIEPQLALLDCHLEEDDVRAQHPALYAYLARGKAAGVSEGYLAARRRPWYRQERREPAPFLCTYMGRGASNCSSPFRFVWNKSRAVATNVYLLLYPKHSLSAVLSRERRAAEAAFSYLQGIDASRLANEGRVYGGGLHKVEPAELGRVPAGGLVDLIADSNAPGRQNSLFQP